ncbi:MAG: glycosyltransferase [Flavobacteriaceae bacterium]
MEKDRKIVLATFGSLGDLFPVVAFGRALKEIGFRPMIASWSDYRQIVEKAGLDFAPAGTSISEMYEIWGMTPGHVVEKMIRDPSYIIHKMAMMLIGKHAREMADACGGAELIIAHPLSFPARVIAEKRGIPWGIMALYPIVMWSAYDPPAGGVALPMIARPKSRIAVAYNRAAIGIVHRILGQQLRHLRELRQWLGMPKLSRARLVHQMNDAEFVIGLFSPHFHGPQPDHPPNTSIVGFPYFDSGIVGAHSGDRELEDFLAAGPPPVVFTLGTLATNIRGNFFEICKSAIKALGMRAILLVGSEHGAELKGLADEDIFVREYLSHAKIFPRASIVVHHGGIGTTAEALRAGKPQLVVPFLGDQRDNAARLERLGVADSLLPRRYRVPAVVAKLRRLGGDAALARKAAELSERVSGEDGAMAGALKVREFLDARRAQRR